jgi:D-3-phosphoglycerate dehydrogenase
LLDDILQESGIELVRLSYVPTEEQLISEINKVGAQALFKRSRVHVTRRILEECPSLFVIQLCCIGDDSVDKQACADHGVMVFNDPISNGRSVVELVIGNMITLSRRLYETNQRCREGNWDKNNHHRFEVMGKNIGILGLGNIGRGVARIAHNLGMNIHFFDTRQVSIELGKELGWTHIHDVTELFRVSDILTVHLSARDIQGLSNEGVLGTEVLEQLGAERENSPKIFLNFARGFLHTPQALIEAIQKGGICKAAVDVYPHEPRKGEEWSNPYADCPDVVVFPHIGASTQEAQPRIARRVGETFLQFSEEGKVRDTPFRVRSALSLSDGQKEGQALLFVCHATTRGTKRAVDEAIYEAGISNLSSIHSDFHDYGFAYEIALMDGALSHTAIFDIVRRAEELTGETNVIRSIRQVVKTSSVQR